MLDYEIPHAKTRCDPEHENALLEGAADPPVVLFLPAGSLTNGGSNEDKCPHQERQEGATGMEFCHTALSQSHLVYSDDLTFHIVMLSGVLGRLHLL